MNRLKLQKFGKGWFEGLKIGDRLIFELYNVWNGTKNVQYNYNVATITEKFEGGLFATYDANKIPLYINYKGTESPYDGAGDKRRVYPFTHENIETYNEWVAYQNAATYFYNVQATLQGLLFPEDESANDARLKQYLKIVQVLGLTAEFNDAMKDIFYLPEAV